MVGCELHRKKCVPCEGGIPRLPASAAEKYLDELNGWRLLPKARAIQTEYKLKNFREAARLITRIARLAESEGHHPDLHLTRYRHLAVVLTTHAINGLSLNDFVLAAKIQKLLSKSI